MDTQQTGARGPARQGGSRKAQVVAQKVHEGAAKNKLLVSAEPLVGTEERYRMICEAAYFLSEQRGFEPGRELEDWLCAEAEIESLIQGTDDAR